MSETTGRGDTIVASLAIGSVLILLAQWVFFRVHAAPVVGMRYESAGLQMPDYLVLPSNAVYWVMDSPALSGLVLLAFAIACFKYRHAMRSVAIFAATSLVTGIVVSSFLFIAAAAGP